MKIAFVGKGGSGKTTSSSLFIRYLFEKGFPVLAVDADINQHLYDALSLEGLNRPTLKLGHNKEELAGLLAGTNKRVTKETLRVSTPLSEGSHVVRLATTDPVLKRFTSQHKNLFFAEVGEFDVEDTNQHCYHFRQKAAEMVLNHIVTLKEQYVVFDMTAGADSFASGLFGKFDLTVLVVEPTAKSTAVFKQYKKYAQDFDIRLMALGNKVEDVDDEDFIIQSVGKENYLGCLPKSKFVKKLEREGVADWSIIEPAVISQLELMKSHIDSVQLDYDAIQKRYEQMHMLAVRGMSNEMDLLKQISPTFSLKSVAEAL